MAEGYEPIIRNYNQDYPEYSGTYGSYRYNIHVEGNIAVITGYVNISVTVPAATTIFTLPFASAFTVYGFCTNQAGTKFVGLKIYNGTGDLATDSTQLPTGVFIFNITVPIR